MSVRCWLNENQHVFVKGFGMGLAPDVGHLVMQVYFTILPVTVFSITEKKLYTIAMYHGITGVVHH